MTQLLQTLIEKSNTEGSLLTPKLSELKILTVGNPAKGNGLKNSFHQAVLGSNPFTDKFLAFSLGPTKVAVPFSRSWE